MKMFQGAGTNEDPFQITYGDYLQIKAINEAAEFGWTWADPKDRETVRQAYRKALLMLFPQLFDHAVLKIM